MFHRFNESMELGMHPAILYPRRSQIRPLYGRLRRNFNCTRSLSVQVFNARLGSDAPTQDPWVQKDCPERNGGGLPRLILQQPPC